jgi:hypothetical protein
MAFHSFYVVRNYISVLEAEEARRNEHSGRLKTSSFNSDIWDEASNVSSLLRKLFGNDGEDRTRSVVTNVINPTVISSIHSDSNSNDVTLSKHPPSESNSQKSENSNDVHGNTSKKT